MDNSDKFTRIEDKINKIQESLHSIDKTMDKNTASLELHMKRSDALEAELKPVKAHVTLMNNIAKIVVFLGILAAIFKNIR